MLLETGACTGYRPARADPAHRDPLPISMLPYPYRSARRPCHAPLRAAKTAHPIVSYRFIRFPCRHNIDIEAYPACDDANHRLHRAYGGPQENPRPPGCESVGAQSPAAADL